MNNGPKVAKKQRNIDVQQIVVDKVIKTLYWEEMMISRHELQQKIWRPPVINAQRIICEKLYETPKEAAEHTRQRRKGNLNSLDWEFNSVRMALESMEKMGQQKSRNQRRGRYHR